MTGSQLLRLVDLLCSCALSAGWLLYHGWGDRDRTAITSAKAMVGIGLALFATAFALLLAFDTAAAGHLSDYLGDLALVTSSYLGIGAGAMMAGLILGDRASRGHPTATTPFSPLPRRHYPVARPLRDAHKDAWRDTADPTQ